MEKKFSKNGGCCSAFGCTMRRGTNLLSNIKMFKFPKDAALKTKWTNAMKRKDWTPSNNSLLCSKHFIEGKPSENPAHPDYIPSVFSFDTKSLNEGQKNLDRFQRSSKRAKIEAVTGQSSYSCSDSSEIDPDQLPTVSEPTVNLPLPTQPAENQVTPTKEIGIQTDICGIFIEELKLENVGLQKKLDALESENEIMRKSLTHVPVYETVVNKSAKTLKFYTGLENFVIFQGLLQYLLSTWKPKNPSLQPCEQFLLVLMKLRLGLLNLDLATRFNISTSSVSRIFHSWLDAMHVNLQRLIVYPSMRTVTRHTPACFRDASIGNVSCIIDCSEIFIEKPKNLNARAQTFSNYKNHNTMKFLIAILPSGVICFISQAWGGRVSDKQITQQSGFLDILRIDDIVLADRGFRVKDLVEAKGANILVPAFTKGKNQLTKMEVLSSRQMSRVRVHIERAIRKVKTFKLLEGTVPISMVKKNKNGVCTIDKVLSVVAALINIGNKLIKIE